jgi:hypothetical protein
MSVSISTLKDDLRGIVHGTTVDKITNLYGIINRAAGELLLDVDLMETKRIVTLSQVFNSIYDYSAPADLKGNRIIDLRPQAGRKGEVWPQRFNQWFDKKKWLKNQNQFTIQHNTGVKSLRIDAPFLTAPIILSATNSTTGWAVGGTASSLSVDTNYMVDGVGCLQFNVGIGTGYIESSTLPIIDLTGHEQIAQEFFWAYFPSAPTSVNLRWGSSTSAYYSGSATIQADGTAFRAGWNNITIPWSSAIATGSPTITSYDTIRFTVIAPTAMTGVKFCTPKSIMGQYLEAEYYSKYFFRNPNTNAFQEKVVDDSSDIETLLNLDTEGYGIFIAKLSELIFQQLQGDNAKVESEKYEQKYRKLLMRYKNLYPSEVQFAQEAYYEPTKGNYDGFVPKIWTP